MISEEYGRIASIVGRLFKQERTQSALSMRGASAAPPPPVVWRNSEPDSDTFVFSWHPVDDPRVAGYNVYRAESPDNSAIAERVTFVSQVPGARGPISYKDPDRNAQNKSYWVASVNASGVESPRVKAALKHIGDPSIVTGPPNAPLIAVVAELLATGSVRYTCGVEKPTQNSVSADIAQFQISRNIGFTDLVYDNEIPCPDNFVWVSAQIAVYYFRARVRNNAGWGGWSAVITKQVEDILETAETGVPSAPQNIVLYADDVDPAVPGNELVVEFERPASNFNTLFAYAVQIHTESAFPVNVQIHSGTASCDRGGFVLTDTSKTFTSDVIGKTVWLHSGYPMTGENLKSTGQVTGYTTTTLTIDSPIRIGGAGVYYQVIVPDWEQVVRSVTLPAKILDPTIQDSIHFRAVVRGLPYTNYYARVRAANVYGIGAWSAVVGPVSLDGIKAGDIKAGAIEKTKFASGLEPIQIVSSLPGSATQGQVVFLTTDNKLYRYTGSSWTAVVPTSDLSGTITETQISNDAISTPKLQANCITAGKLSAGCVETDKILAGAVTAAKMTVSTLSAITVDAGSLTAGTITGLTIRTASSGARIELDSTNGLRGIDSGGNSVTQVLASTGAIYASTYYGSPGLPSGDRPRWLMNVGAQASLEYGSAGDALILALSGGNSYLIASNGISTANMYLRATSAGSLYFQTSTTTKAVVNSSGLNVYGNISVSDTQVVTTRQTGWGAPSGTSSKATFDADSVTLPNLAARVHALIDDLTTHGLIGS